MEQKATRGQIGCLGCDVFYGHPVLSSKVSGRERHFFCPTDNIFLSLFVPPFFLNLLYCDDKRLFSMDERNLPEVKESTYDNDVPS